jgi:acyl-[acyl-carrier-protein]-phospholipid O-acyltransferase/long-chain-fatty-acid--[acyl-carrier-protein] ligase
VIEALPGGLHDTGDIVAIDRQGFVTIKGRAKRFAKIAGETVSLASVEDIIADLWPDHVAAGVAAPDPERGERVIVATTKPGATRAEVLAWMKISGASEIMHPSSIVVLQAIPLLGSGKTNYVALAKALRDSGA